MLDPVETLRHRQEFIEGVCELARLCNWGDSQIQELGKQLWEELVQVDNDTLSKMGEGEDDEEAYRVWEVGMEKIRYWLTLILGIRIKYV